MAWAILITVATFYMGKFFFLSCNFLKEERPIFERRNVVTENFSVREFSLNDFTPQQLDGFIRFVKQKSQDKVNWKVEGF